MTRKEKQGKEMQRAQMTSPVGVNFTRSQIAVLPRRKNDYLWMESVMLFQSAPVSLCREGSQGQSTQLMLTV